MANSKNAKITSILQQVETFGNIQDQLDNLSSKVDELSQGDIDTDAVTQNVTQLVLEYVQNNFGDMFANMTDDQLSNLVSLVSENIQNDVTEYIEQNFNEIVEGLDEEQLKSLVTSIISEGGGLTTDENGRITIDITSIDSKQLEELIMNAVSNSQSIQDTIQNLVDNNSTITEISAKLETAENNIYNLDQIQKGDEADIDDLQERMTNAESDIDTAQSDIEDLKNKHNDLLITIETDETRLTNVENQVSSLEETVTLINSGEVDLTNLVDLTSDQTISGQKTFTSKIVGSLSGDATVAGQLQYARTIKLTGDASGQIGFNGAANVELEVENNWAEEAEKLETGRLITVDLGLAASKGTLFDGSSDVTIGVTGSFDTSMGGTGLTVSPYMIVDLESEQSVKVFQEEPKPGVTGVLPISHGGTGLSTSPTMQINLESTESDSILQEESSPGVTGILAISNGGTGLDINPSAIVNLNETSSANIFAEDITIGVTGMLQINNGGTGLNTPPMAKVNLDYVLETFENDEGETEVESGTNIFQAYPELGIYGTLGIANGGTGLSLTDTGPMMIVDLASSNTVDIFSETPTPGVTGTLPIANGGTGNTSGLAASATKLETARTIQTNLASTSSASFDGSANITPGVTGTLPIANGGTGATSASSALSNLGAIAKSGSRGSLSGYETVSTSSSSTLSITYSSADTTVWTTTGSRTLSFTSAGSSYVGVKIIACSASGSTTLTVSGATWANNDDAPDWGSSGELLVLVASFIAGKVILSVFHNSEA